MMADGMILKKILWVKEDFGKKQIYHLSIMNCITQEYGTYIKKIYHKDQTK